MPRQVSEVLRDERSSLRRQLAACSTPTGEVDLSVFDQFRHRLVWLITVEQRVLLPALGRKLGKVPRFQKGMRRDHTDLVTLCVPSPNAEWLENLAGLFGNHLALEEGPGGLLELVEQHLGADPEVLAAMAQLPTPTLPPFGAGPAVRAQLKAVLAAAGLAEPLN